CSTLSATMTSTSGAFCMVSVTFPRGCGRKTNERWLRNARPSELPLPLPRSHLQPPRHPRPDPIERRRRRDVQAAGIRIPPAEVRGVLRHPDHPQASRVRGEHMDSPRPAAIDVALAVDLHSVRRALAL